MASGAVISRRAKRGVIHLWLGFSFCLASAFFLAHVFWLLIPASDAEGGASKLFFCFLSVLCFCFVFFHGSDVFVFRFRFGLWFGLLLFWLGLAWFG